MGENNLCNSLVLSANLGAVHKSSVRGRCSENLRSGSVHGENLSKIRIHENVREFDYVRQGKISHAMNHKYDVP
jgi:hypothetical protein